MLAGILLSLLFTGCSKPEKNKATFIDVEEEPSYSMYVSSEGLNVRELPTADSSINGVLLQNDKVITDKVSNDGWYKIRAADESVEGYVNAKYLADDPVSEEEIAARKAAEKQSAQEKEVAAQVQADVPEAKPQTQPETQIQAEPETRSAILDDLDTIPDTPRPKLTKLPKN